MQPWGAVFSSLSQSAAEALKEISD